MWVMAHTDISIHRLNPATAGTLSGSESLSVMCEA